MSKQDGSQSMKDRHHTYAMERAYEKYTEKADCEEFNPLTCYRLDYNKGTATPWVLYRVNSYGEQYGRRYFETRSQAWNHIRELPSDAPQTMTQEALDNWKY